MIDRLEKLTLAKYGDESGPAGAPGGTARNRATSSRARDSSRTTSAPSAPSQAQANGTATTHPMSRIRTPSSGSDSGLARKAAGGGRRASDHTARSSTPDRGAGRLRAHGVREDWKG